MFVHDSFTSKEIKGSVNESRNEESEEEYVNGKKCAIHTEFTDISGNSFEFFLKWGSLYSLLKFTENFTYTTVLSNHNNYKPTFTNNNLGS